jgi:hypothetical protein
MALTEFTSGINTSFSTELNDNFLASRPRLTTVSQATEATYAVSSTGFTDTNIVATLNTTTSGLVTSIQLVTDMKVTSVVGFLGIKIEGTNLGTKYIAITHAEDTSADVDYYSHALTTATGSARAFATNNTAYGLLVGGTISLPILLQDTSTTFTAYLWSSSGTPTVSLKNAELSIVYFDGSE